MDIQVRLARPAEAEAMARVLAQAFAAFKPVYTPGGLAATTPDVNQIAARYSEGPLWVAERQGEVVGTISAVPKGDGLYIRSLAVLPAARGQWLGERLVQQAEAYARAQGLTRLFLSTTPVLVGAIRLYERMGFQRTPDGPHDLFGTPLFTMEKLLE